MSSSDSANPSAAPRPSGEFATIRRRFAAMLYELLLLVGVGAVCWLFPWMIMGMTLQWTPPGEVALLDLLLAFGLYFVWYWQRHGQTLAMQTWRLKVVDRATGRNPSLRQALARHVLAWLSLIACGAGFLWAFIDRDRLFLHDRLCGCCVVWLAPCRVS